MGLRRAGAYTYKRFRAYTRKSKVKQKSYIKTIPNSKVVKLKMGDITGFQSGKYPIVLAGIMKNTALIRDNALEAVRQYLHRFLTEKIGKDYYFELKAYPHHMLRENKMITGAGADRMQTGMALSFGRTTGRAAIVKKDHPLFIIAVLNKKHEQQAREMINSARPRLPCTISIQYLKNEAKK